MNPALRCAAILGALAVVPASLSAQYITLKTVPVPAGEQFEILPARNLGMATLGIVLDDPLRDPFGNPARGALLRSLDVHALPTIYGEASGQVGGRSLPIAVLVPGRVFAGAAFALQQVDGPQRFNWWGWPAQQDRVIRDNSNSNVYAVGAIGAKLGDRTAVGVGGYYADLEAIDAVNLLYGMSLGIEQYGSLTDLRAGVLHDFGGERRLDAVVARSSLDMTHNVLYGEWRWEGPNTPPLVRTWEERNQDRTVTWGGSLRYTQPVADDGVRFGALLSGSTKAHPKIPNYNLVNIPRDPGNSAAFNIGAGMSRQQGPATFALELVFEPARSHTWAFADTVIDTPAGQLGPGDKTVDNQFRFRNWIVAVGLDREHERGGFQLGLRLRQIRYSLDQQNFLTDQRRRTTESWMEWTPAWGAVLHFGELSLRYSGRFTARGWPDLGFGGQRMTSPAVPDGTDFIIGPTQPVDLPEFRVTTHRLMVSVPFGR
jgi:hypothetical protein